MSAEYEWSGEWDGEVLEDEDGDLFIQGLQVVEVDHDAETYMTEDGTIWAPPESPLAVAYEDAADEDAADEEEYDEEEYATSEYFDPDYAPAPTVAQRGEAFAEELQAEGATITQIRRDLGRELTDRESNALGHELLEQFDRGERLDANAAFTTAVYFEGIVDRDMNNHADRVDFMAERFEDAHRPPSAMTEDQFLAAERALQGGLDVEDEPDRDTRLAADRADRMALYSGRLSGQIATDEDGNFLPVETREDGEWEAGEDMTSHASRMEHYAARLDFET